MQVEISPPMHERVVCSVAAAAKYGIPANIMLAVAEKENGKPGQWVRNENGTQDVGPMQFNTAYLSELARYGIQTSDVAAAGCYSYELAAWRLRQHIAQDRGDLWTRAANYHSRTGRFNAVYRADLIRRAARWADWLQARYSTYDFLKGGLSENRATGRVQDVVRQARPGELAARHVATEANRPRPRYVPRMLLIPSFQQRQ